MVAVYDQSMRVELVLFFRFVFGFICAAGCSITMLLATMYARRKREADRKSIIRAAALLPFGWFVWCWIVFSVQMFVDETVLHRDTGYFSEMWHCPLSSDYQLLMINCGGEDPADGFVFEWHPGDDMDDSIHLPDCIEGVSKLQVANPYIFGEFLEHNSTAKDCYFILDMRTDKKTVLADLEATRLAASKVGVQLNLQSINEAYNRYRDNWFDVFANILFCGGPLVSFCLLIAGWREPARRSGWVNKLVDAMTRFVSGLKSIYHENVTKVKILAAVIAACVASAISAGVSELKVWDKVSREISSIKYKIVDRKRQIAKWDVNFAKPPDPETERDLQRCERELAKREPKAISEGIAKIKHNRELGIAPWTGLNETQQLLLLGWPPIYVQSQNPYVCFHVYFDKNGTGIIMNSHSTRLSDLSPDLQAVGHRFHLKQSTYVPELFALDRAYRHEFIQEDILPPGFKS